MSYQLHLGNCLDIMPTLAAGSVDMVLADPPYGTTACKWDSVLPFEPMWAGIKHAAKKNAAIALFGNEPFSSRLRVSNLARYKYDWIWRKPKASNALTAKYVPVRHEENIMVFGNGRTPRYNPQMTTGHKSSGRTRANCSEIHKESSGIMASGMCISSPDYDPTKRFPKALITGFSNLIKGRSHPTQKPVALMEYLIRTYTKEGDTVLDFTMGSGTTGVACANTGRNFIGIELDPGYYEIAQKRIAEAQCKPA